MKTRLLTFVFGLIIIISLTVHSCSDEQTSVKSPSSETKTTTYHKTQASKQDIIKIPRTKKVNTPNQPQGDMVNTVCCLWI